MFAPAVVDNFVPGVSIFSARSSHFAEHTYVLVIYIEQFILHSTKGTGLFWVKQRW